MRSFTPCARSFRNQDKLPNNSQLFFKSSTSSSQNLMSNKFRLKYVDMACKLIHSVKQKKLSIQNLLEQQQRNTYTLSINQKAINESLKKLRKVLRLMQIVCKIISEKGSQNNYYQNQINYTGKQQYVHVKDKISFNQQKYQNTNKQFMKQIQANMNKISKQIISPQCISSTETLMLSQKNIGNIESYNNTKKLNKWSKLQLDELNQPEDQDNQAKYTNHDQKQRQNKDKGKDITRQNSNTQLFNSYVSKRLTNQQSNKKIQPPLQSQTNHLPSPINFLKRYKSLLKICINSLNILTYLFIKTKNIQQCEHIHEQLIAISKDFNQKYHSSEIQCKYRDELYVQVCGKVRKIYNNLYRIYKQNFSIIDYNKNI